METRVSLRHFLSYCRLISLATARLINLAIHIKLHQVKYRMRMLNIHLNRGLSLTHGTIIPSYYNSMIKYNLLHETIFFINKDSIDYAHHVSLHKI